MKWINPANQSHFEKLPGFVWKCFMWYIHYAKCPYRIRLYVKWAPPNPKLIQRILLCTFRKIWKILLTFHFLLLFVVILIRRPFAFSTHRLVSPKPGWTRIRSSPVARFAGLDRFQHLTGPDDVTSQMDAVSGSGSPNECCSSVWNPESTGNLWWTGTIVQIHSTCTFTVQLQLFRLTPQPYPRPDSGILQYTNKTKSLDRSTAFTRRISNLSVDNLHARFGYGYGA